MRRMLTAIAVTIGMIVALVVGPAAPASAHHALETSYPEAGAQLRDPPLRLSLTFAFELQQSGATVELVDEAGASWATGVVDVDGADVSVGVVPGAVDGHYEVRWSVISFDGAPLQGIIPFAVGDAGPAANVLNTVISADAASLIRLSAYALFGGLAAVIAVELTTTYGPGRSSRRSTGRKATG